ncbi:hypothetical protein RD792_012594 [Penstemon davidsonii]|uniref:Glucan endo-1,3-beta-D-glucosidase n=1 Tax=Penstemon davidsonii TaxID=160366 RepID=A0ABR0CXA9_9LAMI|nr:hypothetical protein RD792_012594 [Penstemon davidsonii]
MRLYNPNQAILQALRGSGISVIVGVPNEDIQRIAQSVGAAQAWLQQNILNNAGVDFRYIAVGNEISPLDGGSARIAPCVPPAMYNIKAALNRAGLGHKIKVSTALSTGILAQSFPPSAGSFRPEIRPSFLDPIIEFLVNSQFPLLLNVYTYFPYIDNLKDISLEYATFTSPSVVVRDGPFQYQNLFDAIVDATYAALEKAGGANVEIVVSESGWPSAGGTATSVDAARIYNTNLINHVRGGTPKRPGKPIEAYVFDLIDEDQKSPEIEKHWGLFYANKQPKYPITFA